MDIKKLKQEIDTDPLGRGYSIMSDAEVAIDLNTAYRDTIATRLDPADVYNAIDDTEWDALSTAGQDEIYNIIHVGTINGLPIAPGDRARQRIKDVFGISSQTLINLLAIATTQISRGQELGLGLVRIGHVTYARSL